MRRRISAGFWCGCGGASAVEFALLFGPLILLLFGCIEFARGLWARNAVQEIASASARCVGIMADACSASGSYSPSKTAAFAQAHAAGWSLVLPSAGITVSPSTTCGGVSGFAQVSITYTFQTAVPIVLPVLAGGKVLTATACFPRKT